MKFGPRLLSFLEREMEAIVSNRGRDQDDRQCASAILGRVRGELEWNAEQAESDLNRVE